LVEDRHGVLITITFMSIFKIIGLVYTTSLLFSTVRAYVLRKDPSLSRLGQINADIQFLRPVSIGTVRLVVEGLKMEGNYSGGHTALQRQPSKSHEADGDDAVSIITPGILPSTAVRPLIL
jgi:hypothetical protein